MADSDKKDQDQDQDKKTFSQEGQNQIQEDLKEEQQDQEESQDKTGGAGGLDGDQGPGQDQGMDPEDLESFELDPQIFQDLFDVARDALIQKRGDHWKKVSDKSLSKLAYYWSKPANKMIRKYMAGELGKYSDLVQAGVFTLAIATPPLKDELEMIANQNRQNNADL